MNLNETYISIFVDLAIWSVIIVALLGFLAVCYEIWRNHTETRRRQREWQRHPTLEMRPNVRLRKVL